MSSQGRSTSLIVGGASLAIASFAIWSFWSAPRVIAAPQVNDAKKGATEEGVAQKEDGKDEKVQKAGLITGKDQKRHSRAPVLGKLGCVGLPVERSKEVHFIRHGQGHHNVAQEQPGGGWNQAAALDPKYTDARLTELGLTQCSTLRMSCEEDLLDADLVVVSPLTRTLETATATLPSLVGRVPWVAYEGVREHFGKHPCDRRSNTSLVAKEFAHVDFSLVSDEVDVMYDGMNGAQEDEDDTIARGYALLRWLRDLPHKKIVVVSHGGFLSALFHHVLSVSEEHRVWWENCEKRAVYLSFDAVSGPSADVSP